MVPAMLRDQHMLVDGHASGSYRATGDLPHDCA